MRVVVAAVPFGNLDSIPIRAKLEKALKQAAVPYEVTQTALLLDPGAQVQAFARRKAPYLYFLVEEPDLGRARSAIAPVSPHSLEE
jgi:hypothetical protein